MALDDSKIDPARELKGNDAEMRVLSLQVLKKFRLIFGSVRHHFRLVEETCGVSGSQLWVLQEVALSPGIGVSEVAERLSIHQSTCSQLVEKLVGKELLQKQRSLQDQRRVGLTVTDSAREKLALAPGPVEGVLPDALMSLPPESLMMLEQTLNSVVDRLKIHDSNLAGTPLADL